MKIAFVSVARHPSEKHIGGGDVRQWQNFQALHALGHEVHAITVDPQNDVPAELRERASSVIEIKSKPLRPWQSAYWIRRLFNPETLNLLKPDLAGVEDAVQRELVRLAPDLVWAESAFALALVPSHWPSVHSHVDFMFKLRPVRKLFARMLRKPDLVSLRKLEEAEYALCARATQTICASFTEAQLLQKKKIAARYIPVSLPSLPRPDFSQQRTPRLVLFGNPNTAMRATRQHLRHEIWPILERRGLRLDWHQVGAIPKVGRDPSWIWLQEHFTIHGYVDDLASVLRPGDASIMPYPHDTGGRAKFAVASAYGLVNIAYDVTFACANEYVPGVDCVAAKDPEEFVDALVEYVNNESRRVELARNSRARFEESHQLQAQLPWYEEVVKSAAGYH